MGVGHDTRAVELSRIAWLITVGICMIAAVVLLVEQYYGYAGVLAAVGASAAINLR
jgi:membrane protein YdbS with pleckstrin-like domain